MEGDEDSADFRLVVLLNKSESKAASDSAESTADSDSDKWTLYSNGRKTVDLNQINPSKLKSASFYQKGWDREWGDSTDVTEVFKKRLQSELDQSASQNKVQIAKERQFQSFLRHHCLGTVFLTFASARMFGVFNLNVSSLVV